MYYLCLAGRRATKPHEAIGQVSHSLDRPTEKWNHGTIDWRESRACAPYRERASHCPSKYLNTFHVVQGFSEKMVAFMGQNQPWILYGLASGRNRVTIVCVSNGLYDNHACTVTIAIRGA